MDGRSGEPLIPAALLAEIYAHAREAFPLECCGYIAGDRVVRCTNEDASSTSFAIGGRDLLDFARSFDGPAPARVLYHSHTNGRAYISPTDRAQAGGYPVQHLVVGLTAAGIQDVALFDEGFVELARWC